MDDLLTVRFRVGAVYRQAYVSVYFDDERVQHQKKKIMAPGEMEQIILQKKKLLEKPDLRTITIKIEEDDAPEPVEKASEEKTISHANATSAAADSAARRQTI